MPEGRFRAAPGSLEIREDAVLVRETAGEEEQLALRKEGEPWGQRTGFTHSLSSSSEGCIFKRSLLCQYLEQNKIL